MLLLSAEEQAWPSSEFYARYGNSIAYWTTANIASIKVSEKLASELQQVHLLELMDLREQNPHPLILDMELHQIASWTTQALVE
jgi:hypothetical protein